MEEPTTQRPFDPYDTGDKILDALQYLSDANDEPENLALLSALKGIGTAIVAVAEELRKVNGRYGTE